MKLTEREMTELTALLHPLLHDESARQMRFFIQHGHTDCLRHCVAVACWSYWLSKRLRLPCRLQAMVRGAVLHDFFLYDWHEHKKANGRLHGFTHPKTALKNALLAFELSPVERDIIEKHMWPVTVRFPKYREAWLVTVADKICAVLESFALTAGPAYRLTGASFTGFRTQD